MRSMELANAVNSHIHGVGGSHRQARESRVKLNIHGDGPGAARSFAPSLQAQYRTRHPAQEKARRLYLIGHMSNLCNTPLHVSLERDKQMQQAHWKLVDLHPSCPTFDTGVKQQTKAVVLAILLGFAFPFFCSEQDAIDTGSATRGEMNQSTVLVGAILVVLKSVTGRLPLYAPAEIKTSGAVSHREYPCGISMQPFPMGRGGLLLTGVGHGVYRRPTDKVVSPPSGQHPGLKFVWTWFTCCAWSPTSHDAALPGRVGHPVVVLLASLGITVTAITMAISIGQHNMAPISKEGVALRHYIQQAMKPAQSLHLISGGISTSGPDTTAVGDAHKLVPPDRNDPTACRGAARRTGSARREEFLTALDLTWRPATSTPGASNDGRLPVETGAELYPPVPLLTPSPFPCRLLCGLTLGSLANTYRHHAPPVLARDPPTLRLLICASSPIRGRRSATYRASLLGERETATERGFESIGLAIRRFAACSGDEAQIIRTRALRKRSLVSYNGKSSFIPGLAFRCYPPRPACLLIDAQLYSSAVPTASVNAR
ncbi:hypothetical protein G7046_g9310 [Stylonectria norvegica]|nr:hypothetical protein G7046_g9310 [Stylonectria norvegica]